MTGAANGGIFIVKILLHKYHHGESHDYRYFLLVDGNDQDDGDDDDAGGAVIDDGATTTSTYTSNYRHPMAVVLVEEVSSRPRTALARRLNSAAFGVSTALA